MKFVVAVISQLKFVKWFHIIFRLNVLIVLQSIGK